MTKSSIKVFLGLVGAVLVIRLIAMAALPLIETTEPRYAEIARLMATSGDWITPWFAEQVPFWGKPPLSFWAQAASMQWFGINELAVRLPSLVVTLAILGLIYEAARRVYSPQVGVYAALIYMTSAVGFVLAGAVLTDPFLTLAVTLSLVSVLITGMEGERAGWWRYGLFLGAAIGLLAKGPIAVVLIGMPAFFWILFGGRERFKVFPWVTGSLLTLVLAVPWYLLAEHKTPGFLDYFIVGEHIRRFTDPGWAGDLYGNGHQEPLGKIWLLAIVGFFPWSILGLVLLVRVLWRRDGRPWSRWFCADSLVSVPSLLMMWMLWPLIFFSVASNILWTYVQPALPAFALLLAPAWVAMGNRWSLRGGVLAMVLPVAVLGVSVVALTTNWSDSQKTEKNLVNYVEHLNSPNSVALYYLDKAPYSARFYSRGNIVVIDQQQLSAMISDESPSPRYVVVPKREVNEVFMGMAKLSEALYENKRYQLFDISKPSAETNLVKSSLLSESSGEPNG